MIYLIYIILVFFALRFLTAIVNVLSFRYLPKAEGDSGESEVSVLIPARNEEQNIRKLLEQLQGFHYKPLEIIVYNDNSTDGTAEVIGHFMNVKWNIKLIQGEEPPKGWLGKNYACHQLAQAAKGEILLFLDADVNVRDGLLERGLKHVRRHDLHLLSIFPKQILKTTGELLSVPLMNWILLSFLPLILVRVSRNKALSAANGQFMMFRSDTYKLIQPHQLFRGHKVEDIAILMHFKELKLKCDTLLGDDEITCRMYTSLKESMEGFSKNIFQFFGNSILLTILTGLITTISPFVMYFYFDTFAAILYLSGAIIIRISVSLASRQPVLKNLVYMVPQHVVFLLIIIKGIVNFRRRQLIWKGRNIY